MFAATDLYVYISFSMDGTRAMPFRPVAAVAGLLRRATAFLRELLKIALM